MSRGDVTLLEDRLRRTLHEVAGTIPDRAPAAAAGSVPLRALPARDEPGADGSSSRPRAAMLLAAAAVTFAVVAGSVALMTTGHSVHSTRIGAGGEPDTAATSAAPEPTGLVDVPDVVGKQQAEALAIVEQAGFAPRIDRGSGPSGVVVGQDPPDRRAAPGAIVTLYVGAG